MEWISVNDRLPELYDCVNVFGRLGDRFIVTSATLHDNYWFDRLNERVIDVTHWMSLPEPPKDLKS